MRRALLPPNLPAEHFPVITGPRKLFEFVCQSRGYTADEVRPCIVSQDADTVTVDEHHPSYPRKRQSPAAARSGPPSPPPPLGPGGHMKAMLAGWPFRIVATPTCPCNAHARQMDAWGPDECIARMDEIVGWLRAEAERRGLPFSDTAARLLVRRAIWKARKSH